MSVNTEVSIEIFNSSEKSAETRLSEIENKVNLIYDGFENIKKASDERIDAILNESMIMREESDAKNAEILMLHSRLNQQDKEIEMLKLMIAEQKEILALYMDLHAE